MLGVASAATCPKLAQEAFNNEECTDMQDGVETYTPDEGCVKFRDQKKENRALWIMSGGSSDDTPAAVMSDCTWYGHKVTFFSDEECNNKVRDHLIKWGSDNTCVRLGQSPVWLTEVVIDQTWIE